MNCRTSAVILLALTSILWARGGEMLSRGRGDLSAGGHAQAGPPAVARAGRFRTKLDSIRSLLPNLMYYAMMKDPELRDLVDPVPDSEGVRMVGSWNRGPSWNVTGKDTLVYLNLGSECAIINFADPERPRVLSEIPARDYTPRSCIKDSLLFIGGCGIDIWNVKHPTAPQFLSRINLTVSDIAVQDSFLYTVNADSFCVFSFADPSVPVLVGASGDTGFLMTVSPGRAYVSTRWTMAVVDVSDPRHPNWVGTYPARTGCLFARDTLVYATVWASGFQILNVSDPGNVRMIGSLPSLEIMGYIDVRDFFVYAPNFAVIDVGDPTHPTIVSQCPTSGEQFGVWVRDPWSYAYVADVENGLQVVDIHDPVHPALDTTVLQGGFSKDIAVRLPLAVVATPDAGLRILDVSDPAVPREVGAYDTVGRRVSWEFDCVALAESFAFTGGFMPLHSVLLSDPTRPIGFRTGSRLAKPSAMSLRGSWLLSAEMGRFHVFDISSPQSPSMLSETRLPDNSEGMSLRDSIACIGCWFSGLVTVNIARPSNPFILDTLRIPGGAWGVFIKDTLVFVAASDSGLIVVNIKNPRLPFIAARLPLNVAGGVTGTGDRLYVGTLDGLVVVDISDPAHPVETGHYDIPGGFSKPVLDSDLIYCVRGDPGVCVLECLPSAIREKTQGVPTALVRTHHDIAASRIELDIYTTKGGDCQTEIFDIQGRRTLKRTLKLPAGPSSVSFDLSDLPSGVYLLRIEADGRVASSKIAKMSH